MMLQYANKALEYLTKEGVIAEIFDYYAGMNYDPEKPGYYTSDPSALSRITAIAHYRPADKYTFEIVTNPDFPPYEYTIADKYYGIDMDIWKAIAATLDCNVHFNFMEFDSIINAIQNNRYDAGASGFTVTDERKLSINFSNTYAVAHQYVGIIKNGPLSDVTSWEELQDHKVAVESGTTGYYLAEEVFGIQNVMSYNQYTDVVQSLLTGYSDFVVIDDLVLTSFIEEHPDELAILDVELPGAEAEEYAFVFNKGVLYHLMLVEGF